MQTAGRLRSTSCVDVSVKKKPFMTAPQVQDALQDVGGHVSLSTINRRLDDQNLTGFSTTCKPQTQKSSSAVYRHKQKERVDLWNKVLSADETKMNLYQNNGKKKVWRRKGAAPEPKTRI